MPYTVLGLYTKLSVHTGHPVLKLWIMDNLILKSLHTLNRSAVLRGTELTAKQYFTRLIVVFLISL